MVQKSLKKKTKRTKDERLLEYYFVVGASQKSVDAICSRLAQKNLAPRSGGKAYFANFAYKPKVIDRYPLVDHPENPLLNWVARSCLPRGVRVRTKPPAPKFGWFVGWSPDGMPLYGSYLVVFEKLPLPNQSEPVYQPKALGLISHFPMFYAFEVFLTCLWHSVPKNIITLEELLVHYFRDIPAPAEGYKISYDLGKMKVGLVRPKPLDLPIVELPRCVLFQRLSVDRIAVLIKCILLQKRIILVSSTECELMAVSETLRSLIFPLKWKHLYIPLMTRNVGSKLYVHQGPFLVGVPRFMLKRPEFSKFPKHSIVVFLDKNEIRLANTLKSVNDLNPVKPLWPTESKRALKKVMEDAACVLTEPAFSEPDQNKDDYKNYKKKVYGTLEKVFSFMCKLLRNTKSNKNQFTRKFAETELYKDFLTDYSQRNPSDRKLQGVYKYYMDRQSIKTSFSIPARGTLAKIARGTTQHYANSFPVVNEKIIMKRELKHQNEKPNPPIKRPKCDKCYPEALEFIYRALLNPQNKKPQEVPKADNEPHKPTLASTKKHQSKRITIINDKQKGLSETRKAGSPQKEIPEQSTVSAASHDSINVNSLAEQTSEIKKQEIFNVLQDIVDQAKKTQDLPTIQEHLSRIREILNPADSADHHSSPSPGLDDYGNLTLDESTLKAFAKGNVSAITSAHFRTSSMSTVASSRDESSDEDWEVSSDWENSDPETAPENIKNQEPKEGSFRNLDEWSISNALKFFKESESSHNKLLGKGKLSFIHPYKVDLLDIKMYSRYEAFLKKS